MGFTHNGMKSPSEFLAQKVLGTEKLRLKPAGIGQVMSSQLGALTDSHTSVVMVSVLLGLSQLCISTRQSVGSLNKSGDGLKAHKAMSNSRRRSFRMLNNSHLKFPISLPLLLLISFSYRDPQALVDCEA